MNEYDGAGAKSASLLPGPVPLLSASACSCFPPLMGIGDGLSAQEVTAARASAPVTLDGRIEAAEWEGAGTISSFTQLQPVAGEPATQNTTIHILYDDRMIYFGIESRDSDPSRISRTVTRRDGEVWEDDAVALILDTFDDDNNAYVFMVNSLGTQQDERWADNGRTRDVKWDANWTSAGAIDRGRVDG